MAKKKIITQAKTEQGLDDYLKNPRFGRAADTLLESVRTYFVEIKGVTPTTQQVKDTVIKIVEERK